MPATTEEDTKVLTRLGLTVLQAEVYLALAKLNRATIKTISSTSNIDRANVYRVLTRLQEINLVEKLLSTPTMFSALPINEGIQMLLDRKEMDDKTVKAQANELLQKYKQSKREGPSSRDSEFILIPDGKLTKRKVAEMVDLNLKTHDVIIYWSDFKSQITDVAERWRNLLVKGVKIRAAVYLGKNERLPNQIQSLKTHGEFQVRRNPNPPKATISIIDGNQALISIEPSICPSGKPGLWVSNPGFVGLIQEYFEMIWGKSKKLS